MTSSDGETCYDDDYSDLEDASSLGGWLVQDDFVEYVDQNDAYLDDEEEEEPVSCTTLTRKKRRLIRAEPETDDEQDNTRSKWLVLDEDDDESPAQIAVA